MISTGLGGIIRLKGMFRAGHFNIACQSSGYFRESNAGKYTPAIGKKIVEIRESGLDF